MTTAQNRTARPWRRHLGTALFIVSLSLPLVAAVFVPLLGLPAGVNTALFALSLAGGPDALLVAAVAVMGKENMERLTSKLGVRAKRLLGWDAVTRSRYIVGLWLLVISLFAPLATLFLWGDSVTTAGGQPGWGFWLMLGSSIVFIGAFLSMGAPLWVRVQAVFTWDATVTMPDADEPPLVS